MKKIAIITLYGNNNFGNKLQNYATQVILEKMGYEVTTIRNKITFKNKKENLIFITKNIIKFLLNIKYFKKNKNREIMFNEFNENINYSTDIININNVPRYLNNQFDYFIYGSDQVWSPYAGGGSDLYLGIFSERKKNISFAASFGVYNIKENYKKNYLKGLKNFKAISVREDVGKTIVKEIADIDCEVLIDPTMLLQASDWEKLIKKPKNLTFKKYILNYFLGEIPENDSNEIKRIANKYNCEIINILNPNDKFYTSGPAEFLYLVKNAFLVCTDSFHASVFALLFDVSFLVFERGKIKDSMNSRIDTLLSKFQLDNRKYVNGNITENNLNHDYSNAYKILLNERKKSELFLRKNLGTRERQ